MTTEQPDQSRLSNIDKFGLGTGLIGLVADVVSLAGLFTFSSSAQGTPIPIWIFVLISLIYSIAATNFYARRYFCKRVIRRNERLSRQELRRVEEGTASVTALISFPTLIAYFTFAFFAESEFFRLYFIQSITRGLCIGGLVAFLVVYCSQTLIRSIYRAFDPVYGLSTDSPPFGRP
jgi:hypothetical protein